MTVEEKKARLQVRDIVVVTSDAVTSANPGVQYLGALCVVHEVRAWGVLGAIPVPWAAVDAIIPMRLAWEDFELTGGRYPPPDAWLAEEPPPDNSP